MSRRIEVQKKLRGGGGLGRGGGVWFGGWGVQGRYERRSKVLIIQKKFFFFFFGGVGLGWGGWMDVNDKLKFL